jgi:hypothetical protein
MHITSHRLAATIRVAARAAGTVARAVARFSRFTRSLAASASRRWIALLSGGVLASASAVGAGFGEAGGFTVLGQPLDFAVNLRIEPGEFIGPECLAADVLSGDRKLSADQVRTSIQPTSAEMARVRVATTTVMDEPVITVQLTVGCQTRISRRFVVLADPPITAAAVPAAALPLASAVAPAAAASSPALPSSPAVRSGPVAPSAAGGSSGERPAAPRPRAARSASAARTADGAAPSARPARSARDGSRTRSARPTAAAPAAVAAAPRLRLDVSEPVSRNAEAQAVEQAIEAVAQAASAARAAASAASAAQERIATLERSVEQLRGEANRSRDLAAQMREQLAAAQGASRWLYPLLAGVLLLAAVAVWLAMRLAQLRRETRRSWVAAAHSPGPVTAAPTTEPVPSKQATSPIPFVTSEIVMPPPAAAVARARPAGAPAWPPPAPRDPDLPPEPFVTSRFVEEPALPPPSLAERTLPLPPHVRNPDGSEGSLRDVSIEELLDLEQQAEFFIVLGQDEAAVDLLVEHLRSTGGGSPLPYLKLLEIYHRRGDKDAYERTRSRFNHRFNAYAPDWDTGLLYGRSLEDYTGVLPRLTQVWPRPLDAMAELEALLFRKSRGDLFDLPAYREVLFLYSLARDLLDREAAETGNIDLLLPLPNGSEFSATTPHPYFGLERDSVFDRHAADDRPTSPIDLDLTPGDSTQSIFDTTPDERTRRR